MVVMAQKVIHATDYRTKPLQVVCHGKGRTYAVELVHPIKIN